MEITSDITKAISALNNGAVVIYPTDTIFALGANAFDEHAVDRVFRIKHRPYEKPMPIMIADFELVNDLAYVDDKISKILQAVWPGPVTVVLKKKNVLPDILSAGLSTIAIRIPDSEIAQKLASQFPVVCTSANLSGKTVEQTVFAITNHFQNHFPQPDMLFAPTIDYSNSQDARPSTILDLTTPKPKILRVGMTTKKQLLEILSV